MSALKPDAVEHVRARTVLTPASGYLHAYTRTLNPYMGCAFGENGCGVYCYVAESPIASAAGKAWGQWVKAKVNAAEALRRELERSADRSSLRVFMSSATDPYQPAEAKLRITRSLLETFLERPIALLVVQTRSPLIDWSYSPLPAYGGSIGTASTARSSSSSTPGCCRDIAGGRGVGQGAVQRGRSRVSQGWRFTMSILFRNL